ncbi:hypothetical protein KGMB01110_27510 [Mediterraneibacter butyricigenes]|uniref:Uncharacterized protein n=1 Tax=Mediterraneibacter butyricigenes TaxID=2316025 RepID=A0A391P3W6_9FIRM|nr:hypothetical protein KGMB01110_27510 [Mediterraneibacter butyricigenes]
MRNFFSICSPEEQQATSCENIGQNPTEKRRTRFFFEGFEIPCDQETDQWKNRNQNLIPDIQSSIQTVSRQWKEQKETDSQAQQPVFQDMGKKCSKKSGQGKCRQTDTIRRVE